MARSDSDEIGPNLKELKEEVRKFNDLLQDPCLGLITWKSALYDQGEKVLRLLNKLGFASNES